MAYQDQDGNWRSADGTNYGVDVERAQMKDYGGGDPGGGDTTMGFGGMIADQNRKAEQKRREREEAEEKMYARQGLARKTEEEAKKLYENGNYADAADLYYQAADTYPAGLVGGYFSKARCRAGYMLFKMGNYDGALKMYMRNDIINQDVCPYRCELYAAMGDYEKAVEDCGFIVSNGYFDEDPDRSIRDKKDVAQMVFSILATAAEKGITKAYGYLGACYLKGDGVAEDKEKAREWYQKGAGAGDKRAEFMLHNFIPNYKEMRAYMKKIAKAGNGYAKKWLRDGMIDGIFGTLGFKGWGDATGVGKTFFYTLLVVVAGVLVLAGLELPMPSGTNSILWLAISFAVIFISMLWRHRILIILELLIVAAAIFGVVHATAIDKENHKAYPPFIMEKLSSMGIVTAAKAAIEQPQTAPAAPEAPKATALNPLILRAEPSAKAKSVKTVAKGETVSVIGAPKNGWQMVMHGTDKGWVSSKHLKAK